jgi:hypothetical protein
MTVPADIPQDSEGDQFMSVAIMPPVSDRASVVRYVHRRDDGSIASAHEEPQKGYAEEALDTDKSAELVAFLNPAPPPIITATEFLDRLGADGPALMATPFAFMLVRLAAAGTIRVDDQAVVAGMEGAVKAGAISSERAAELLAPPA